MTEAQKREERPATAAQLNPETTYNPKGNRRQAAGQLLRAALLDEQADRLALTGDYRAARRLRHEAHRLRRLARPRIEAPAVDVERQLAAARLARWAARSAA